VTVVMGLDQHRAQITAEWLGTETGEVSRARVRPADRDGVRRFLSRFADRQVEVALEAATGWRFVVEEIRAIGARAHLAEPAEASALKGNKKRAKTDRADARQVVAPVRDDARAREAGAVDLPETSLGDPPIRRDR
jgi:transposase